jgi:hypothetical protein
MKVTHFERSAKFKKDDAALEIVVLTGSMQKLKYRSELDTRHRLNTILPPGITFLLHGKPKTFTHHIII